MQIEAETSKKLKPPAKLKRLRGEIGAESIVGLGLLRRADCTEKAQKKEKQSSAAPPVSRTMCVSVHRRKSSDLPAIET